MAASDPSNRSDASLAAYKAFRSVTSLAATVFERICCSILEQHCPRFLSGLEGASADCGLLVGDAVPPAHVPPRDRLRWALRSVKHQNAILALDFKTITPTAQTRSKGPIYEFRIDTTKRQKNVAALIVGNTARPDLVAVVPHYYLDRGFPRSRAERRMYTSRAAYICTDVDALELFPVEWAPFVMHISKLPEAMEGLFRFYSGQGNWSNPTSNAEYTLLPKPPTCALELLLPSKEDGRAGEDELIQEFRTACDEPPGPYRCEPLLVRPGAADFQLVRRREPQSRAAVELKRQMARVSHVSSAPSLSCNVVHNGRPTFNAWQPVDLYFLTLTAPKGQVLVLPSHLVPKDWYGPFPQATEIGRTWTPTDPGLLRDHTLSLPSHGPGFAQKLEAVLDKYDSLDFHQTRLRDASLSRTVVPAPGPDPLDLSSLTEALSCHPYEASDLNGPTGVEAEETVAGGSRQWSRLRYSGREAELLDAACKRLNAGCVVALGKHPCGGAIYSPVRATSFAELATHAPHLFLNFAPVQLIDKLVPSDMRRPINFLHVTHGKAKSVYILAPSLYGDTHNYITHAAPVRFVVPSDALWNEGLQNFNESLIKTGHVSTRTVIERDLPLDGGEIIDHYRCSIDDTVASLRAVFEQMSTNRDFHIGTSRAAYPISDYVTAKQKTLQTGIDFLQGSSFWAFKNTVVADGLGPGSKIGGQGGLKAGPVRAHAAAEDGALPEDSEPIAAEMELSEDDEEFLQGLAQ